MINYNTIVLSGGSLKCLAYIGCIKYFQENENFKNIKKIIGTSAGSILGLFIILDYKYNEIEDFFLNIVNDNDMVDLDILQCMDIFESYGLNNGDIINKLIEKILYTKLSITDITFNELSERIDKELVVCVSLVDSQKTEFFSLKNTPNLSIKLAIKASCSVPILFTPVNINNKLYVDGGIYNNFPINYDDIDKETTFGINIYNKKLSTDTFIQYLKCIIENMIKSKTDTNYDINDKNILTLYISDVDWINDKFKINLTKKIISFLVKKGYDEINNHFKSYKQV